MRPVLVSLLLLGATAYAAQLPEDPRLAPVREALNAGVDAAVRDGVPEALLVDKVREGLAKGVAAPRIAQVVEALARALRAARAEVAPFIAAPPPGLLKAVAEAHGVGADRRDVEVVLRAAREAALATRAVEVLTELVLRSYAHEQAARVVAQLAARGSAAVVQLAARAESLVARDGLTRAEALDALARARGQAGGFEGAAAIGRHLGATDENGPNRETEGPRGLGRDRDHGTP
jgi:hypothetical protein